MLLARCPIIFSKSSPCFPAWVFAAFWILAVVVTGGAHASDQSPPKVGLDDDAFFQSVFADESVWPPRLRLTKPLVAPDGRVLVPEKKLGVLVYMRDDGEARLAFGRYGVHTVHVRQTNLREEVERVRAGTVVKAVPNVTGMVALRMGNPAAEKVEMYPSDPIALSEKDLLFVFADPMANDPAALAKWVEPLGKHLTLGLTIMVPRTDAGEATVWKTLHDAGWTSPYVVTMSAPSTFDAMLDPDVPLPYARLTTPNGRVLGEGAITDETRRRLDDALSKRK